MTDFSWSKAVVLWRRVSSHSPRPWRCSPPLPGTGTRNCWSCRAGSACRSAWKTTLPERTGSGHGRRGRDEGLSCEEQPGGWESFAVARAVDVTAEHESSSAKLGGNGLRGSDPASWGSDTASRASDLVVYNGTRRRAGRKCKGRQVLGLACAHKGLVVTHRRPG